MLLFRSAFDPRLSILRAFYIVTIVKHKNASFNFKTSTKVAMSRKHLRVNWSKSPMSAFFHRHDVNFPKFSLTYIYFKISKTEIWNSKFDNSTCIKGEITQTLIKTFRHVLRFVWVPIFCQRARFINWLFGPVFCRKVKNHLQSYQWYFLLFAHIFVSDM